jgi:hypothetical protein
MLRRRYACAGLFGLYLEALTVGREGLGEAPHDGRVVADDAEGVAVLLELAAHEGGARLFLQGTAGRPRHHRMECEQAEQLLNGSRRLVESMIAVADDAGVGRLWLLGHVDFGLPRWTRAGGRKVRKEEGLGRSQHSWTWHHATFCGSEDYPEHRMEVNNLIGGV